MSRAQKTPRFRRVTTSSIAELVAGAAWLLGLSAALLIADGFLRQVPMARALLTALATSIAVGRAGVLWDEGDPAGADYARSARLAFQGLVRGAVASLVAVLIAALAGWVTVGAGRPNIGALLALSIAVATAVREELVFRALPFHFMRRAGVRPEAAVVFSTLLSPTSFALLPGTTPAAVALSLGFGFLSARLLARTGSVWGSVGVNVGARIVLGPVLQTALFSFAWQEGEGTFGPLASGAPALVAAALAIVIGFVGLQRAPKPAKKTK